MRAFVVHELQLTIGPGSAGRVTVKFSFDEDTSMPTEPVEDISVRMYSNLVDSEFPLRYKNIQIKN